MATQRLRVAIYTRISQVRGETDSIPRQDAETRKYVRRHMREVHRFIEDLYRRAQAAGGLPANRDPAAEAWIGIGIGLLRSVQDRLGGLLTPDDFAAILAARRRSLVDSAADEPARVAERS